MKPLICNVVSRWAVARDPLYWLRGWASDEVTVGCGSIEAAVGALEQFVNSHVFIRLDADLVTADAFW